MFFRMALDMAAIRRNYAENLAYGRRIEAGDCSDISLG